MYFRLYRLFIQRTTLFVSSLAWKPMKNNLSFHPSRLRHFYFICEQLKIETRIKNYSVLFVQQIMKCFIRKILNFQLVRVEIELHIFHPWYQKWWQMSMRRERVALKLFNFILKNWFLVQWRLCEFCDFLGCFCNQNISIYWLHFDARGEGTIDCRRSRWG